MGFEDLFRLGSKGKGSNNTIIWILLFIVIFGFGKGKNLLGHQSVSNTCLNDKHRGRGRSRRITPAPYPSGGILGGLGIPGFGGAGGAGGILGGNGAFLLVIIALLFLCKDPKKDDTEEIEED